MPTARHRSGEPIAARTRGSSLFALEMWAAIDRDRPGYRLGTRVVRGSVDGSMHAVSVRVGHRRRAGAALGAAPAPSSSRAHGGAGARSEDPAPAPFASGGSAEAGRRAAVADRRAPGAGEDLAALGLTALERLQGEQVSIRVTSPRTSCPRGGSGDRGEVEERQRQASTVTQARESPQDARGSGGQVARQTQQRATRIPDTDGPGDGVQPEETLVTAEHVARGGRRRATRVHLQGSEGQDQSGPALKQS